MPIFSSQTLNDIGCADSQVTHSPATHVLMCEGRRWRFLGYDEADLQFSLQGHIRIRPVGIMAITFDDGDVYEWTAVNSFPELPPWSPRKPWAFNLR